MISTSAAYKTAVTSDTREWALRLKVKAEPHEYALDVDDIELGSLVYEESVFSGDFGVGGGIMSELSATLSDKFTNIQLTGADVTAEIGLKVNETYEYIPLGVFVIDEAKKANGVISIKAFDNLAKADIPFKCNQFPITVKNLVTLACAQSKIAAQLSFYNDDYLVDELSECSCRDVITWAAELACCWARCDRQGTLEFVPVNNAGYVTEANIDGNDTELVGGGTFDRYNDFSVDGGVFIPKIMDFQTSPGTRYSSSTETEPVIVTGIVFETEETVYLAGSERYALDLSDNALIKRDIPGTIAGIHSKLNGYTYLPFSAEWIGNPAVQAGDLVDHTIADKTYRTIAGKSRFSFRGKSVISADGQSTTASQWKSPTEKAQTRIRERLVEKQEQLDLLDKAVATATSVILAGALGGYAIDGDEVGYPGNHFIADNRDITLAVKVWRWNINGFGFSGTGVDGPYATAITADGSIVASTVTADAIRTGVLQSLNGKSWIDLDNGAFSFGDGSLKWDSANGFEAVSAEKLKTKGSNAYGRIGFTDGRIGLQLWHPDYNPNTPYFHVLEQNGGTEFQIYSAGRQVLVSSVAGTHIVYDNGAQQTEINCDVNGVNFVKNGQQIGATGTHWVRDSGGNQDKALVFKNGLLVDVHY